MALHNSNKFSKRNTYLDYSTSELEVRHYKHEPTVHLKVKNKNETVLINIKIFRITSLETGMKNTYQNMKKNNGKMAS